jgi:mRNA interferase RelE/StbE
MGRYQSRARALTLAFTVVLKPCAIKQLDGLPAKDAKKVAAKLDKLTEQSAPTGAKKIQGHDSLWRLRFGNYRIVYAAPDKDGMIVVLKIAQRGDVYKLL